MIPAEWEQARRRSPRGESSGLLTALVIIVMLLFAVSAMGERTAGEQAVATVHTPFPPRKPPRLPPKTADSWRLRAAVATARDAPARVAFALVMPNGRVVGHDMHAQFRSASLSKSLLAVTLLNSGWARDPRALADARAMVQRSDNAAATRTLARVGAAAVYAQAARAGMRSFRLDGSWAEAIATPYDYALLFERAPDLVPEEFRATLRAWFEHVHPSQSWGVPAALRPRGARVMFKGGWRTGIVHQAARVEISGRAYGLAVLTDRNRSGMRGGVTTIARIATQLLGSGRWST
jgi:hypothetical protein